MESNLYFYKSNLYLMVCSLILEVFHPSVRGLSAL